MTSDLGRVSLRQRVLDHSIGTVGIRVLRFLVFMLLVRVFGPERFGQYQNYLLLLGLAQACIPLSTGPYLAQVRTPLGPALGAALVMAVMVVLGQALLFLALLIWGGGLGAEVPAREIHMLLGLATIVALAPHGLEGLYDRLGQFRWPKGGEAIAVVAGAVLAILARSWIAALAAGYAFSQAIRSLALVSRLPSVGRISFSREAFRAQLAFSGPLVLSGVTSFAMERGDDLAVAHFGGAEALALYAVAFYIPGMLQDGVWILARPVVPKMAELAEAPEALGRLFSDLDAAIAYVVGFGALSIITVGDWVLPALLGEDWAPAMPMMRAFALLFLVRGSVGFSWTSLAVARARTRPLMVTSWISAVAMLAVGIPMIARYGPWGGVVFQILPLAVLFPVASLLLVKRELGSVRWLRNSYVLLASALVLAGVGEGLRWWLGVIPGSLLALSLVTAVWFWYWHRWSTHNSLLTQSAR